MAASIFSITIDMPYSYPTSLNTYEELENCKGLELWTSEDCSCSLKPIAKHRWPVRSPTTGCPSLNPATAACVSATPFVPEHLRQKTEIQQPFSCFPAFKFTEGLQILRSSKKALHNYIAVIALNVLPFASPQITTHGYKLIPSIYSLS